MELNEHPRVTVQREIIEELNIEAKFLVVDVFFLTQTVTVGLTAGHTDVSLWYVLEADSTQTLQYDPREFNGYKWFSYDEIVQTPLKKLDPNLHRFVRKWMNINS
ncbi:MAG: NUDIX hydrolase [Patescibacteria group bacterium]